MAGSRTPEQEPSSNSNSEWFMQFEGRDKFGYEYLYRKPNLHLNSTVTAREQNNHIYN